MERGVAGMKLYWEIFSAWLHRTIQRSPNFPGIGGENVGQFKNVQTYLDTINNNLSTLNISGGMGIRCKCVYQGATLHGKKVIAFPVRSRDVTNHCNQILPGWE